MFSILYMFLPWQTTHSYHSCSQELPEADEKEMSMVLSEEQASIAKSLGACLTPVNAPDELTNPLDFNNSDLSTLSF